MKEIFKKILILILLVIFIIITINTPFGDTTIKVRRWITGRYPMWMFEGFTAILMIFGIVKKFYKNKITKINILGVLILIIYSIFNYTIYAHHIEMIKCFRHTYIGIFLLLISVGCIHDREMKSYFKAVKELREENRKRKNDEDTKV